MCQNDVEMPSLFEFTLDTSFRGKDCGDHGDRHEMDSQIILKTTEPAETDVGDFSSTPEPEHQAPAETQNTSKIPSEQSVSCSDVWRINEEETRSATPLTKNVEKKPSSVKLSSSKSSVREAQEKLKSVRENVERAIREHKTFSIVGNFPVIRQALKQRGWVEKVDNRLKQKNLQTPTVTEDELESPLAADVPLQASKSIEEIQSETVLLTRMLRDVTVDFLWTLRHGNSDSSDLDKGMIVNKLPRPKFTTKVGLCNFLQQLHWFCEDGVSHTLFPRCYNICSGEDRSAFIADFRLTACLGLLKWLVYTYEFCGEGAIKSSEGKIPYTAVQFAIKRCCEYISTKSHEDIDKEEVPTTWDHQWDQFLTWYYSVVHDKSLLKDSRDPPVKKKGNKETNSRYSRGEKKKKIKRSRLSHGRKMLITSAKSTLLNMRKHWPQMNLDGYLNIWIVKPGNKCRGRGIQLMNRLEHVLYKINPALAKESRYVVQKYIERPLLIHKTKFDIRQWFLVTSTHPLTVWLYKECYLRFCSQPFSLRNLHESVHLCNNAVQCKYKNAKRDPALPDENMWDNYTFKTFLRAMGHAEKYDKVIYPGMRESIIGALLSSQDQMDRRKNAFELFGADFMVTEDFTPWLIEINSSPCMSPTTSVTARMCAQCFEDVIKVVIDRRHNRRASTGMFELVYKQQIPPTPPYLGMTLSIQGKKIMQYRHNHLRSHIANTNVPRVRKHEEKESRKHKHVVKEIIKSPRDYIGPIIVDLIEDLARTLDTTPAKQKLSFPEKEVDNMHVMDTTHPEGKVKKKGSRTKRISVLQASRNAAAAAADGASLSAKAAITDLWSTIVLSPKGKSKGSMAIKKSSSSKSAKT